MLSFSENGVNICQHMSTMGFFWFSQFFFPTNSSPCAYTALCSNFLHREAHLWWHLALRMELQHICNDITEYHKANSMG